jgi:hypothetical protein
MMINWPKIVLYGLLVLAVLAVPIGWALDHYHAKAAFAELMIKFNDAATDARLAHDANTSNLSTITTLKAANKTLADERAAQLEAAAQAELRLAAVRAELGVAVAKNDAQRQKLAEENADFAAYLDAGMPCELAQQLWPSQDPAAQCPH